MLCFMLSCHTLRSRLLRKISTNLYQLFLSSFGREIQSAKLENFLSCLVCNLQVFSV